MTRPPRPRGERLLSRRVLARVYAFLGLLEGIGAMTSFFIGFLLGGWRWLADHPAAHDLPVAYFGASTGAAAALRAASELGYRISAVVSRGGRPDLAWDSLADVRAPTLLIVGGGDGVVLEMNEAAATQLRCPNELEVIPGATHLFEEPGALEQVAALAGAWFTKCFADKRPAAGGAF